MRIIDLLLQGKKATQDKLGGYYFIRDNKIIFCNEYDERKSWESFYIKNDFLLEEGYEYK